MWVCLRNYENLFEKNLRSFASIVISVKFSKLNAIVDICMYIYINVILVLPVKNAFFNLMYVESARTSLEREASLNYRKMCHPLNLLF